MTGDGQDEAIVVIKIETTGSAVPQIVYVFTYKEDQPELIWYFRTGDPPTAASKTCGPKTANSFSSFTVRTDSCLARHETSKITDDFEQNCCPTFFTRSSYKWNGRKFQMQGKRSDLFGRRPQSPARRKYVRADRKAKTKRWEEITARG